MIVSVITANPLPSILVLNARLEFAVVPPPIVVTDNGGVCTKVVEVVPNNNHSTRRRPRPNHLHININCASGDLSHESLPSHKVGKLGRFQIWINRS
jgi:hypothetical protein